MPKLTISPGISILLLIVFLVPATLFAQAQKIYWADEFAGRIYKSDPDGANLETLITGDFLDGQEIVLGGGRLYWSDAERGLIQRADIDGTNLVTVIHTPGPRALGLDIGAGKIYWVDNSLDEIRRANLDGSSIQTVELLPHPATALTVDEAGQKIVWAEYDPDLVRANIRRRDIAGGPIQTVTFIQGNMRARGLAVDATGTRIYFGLGAQMLMFNTNTGGLFTLYSGGVSINAVACDDIGGKLYWADDGNNDVTRCDLDGSNVEILDSYARNVNGMAVDSAGLKLYWEEERYIVQSELDGTGQVRIIMRPSYYAVGFHETLKRLYYSDLNKNVTHYADADGTNQTVFWPGMSSSTGGALSIQVDQAKDQVYWLDGGDRWMRKADPDGGNVADIFYLTGDAYDMTLDLPSERVYWCGRSSGGIYRRNLDGSGLTDTLYTGLNLPKGLTLDYVNGRVIWGEDDQIAHGPINGGGPVEVCYTDPFSVIGMAWDETASMLFWADQLNSRVRVAQYDEILGGWQPPVTIFSMGFTHWPGRLVLQYGSTSGVDDALTRLPQEHFAAPNPFNPATEIHFRLAAEGPVSVGIYDVTGRLVRELQQGTRMGVGPQVIPWDGCDSSGRAMASGLYMYRIETVAEALTGKLVLLR